MSLGRPAVAGSFQRLERSLRREHPCPHLDLSLLAPEPEDSIFFQASLQSFATAALGH